MTNLVHRLADQAETRPGQPAIIDARNSISYRDFWRRIGCGASALREKGLQKGDPILLLHPISIELYELLLSCLHAGLTVILIDPAQGIDFLETCLKKLPPAAFLGSPKAHLLRLKSSGLRKVPIQIHTGKYLPFAHAWKPSREPVSITDVHPDSTALLTFTSGSTGQPKGVARSHRFLLAQDEILSRSLNLHPGQVDLVTLPVFLLSNLSHGLTSVIADTDLSKPGTPNITRITEQCRRHQVTRCTASPAFFKAFQKAQFQEAYTGGAPVFPDLLDHLPENSHWVYGSSEAEPIAHFPARDFTPDTLKTIKEGGGLPAGTPVKEIDLAIIKDLTGDSLPSMSSEEFDLLKAGCGEIVVSGDHVLKGYLDGQGDSENKFQVDGEIWHRTGDAGRLDEQGNLWLLGRCHAKWKEFYPLQIEAAIRASHPGIKCAIWNGILVLEQDFPDLKPLLHKFSITEIRILDSIPMDPRHNAKINYPALRKLLNAGKTADR